VLAYLERAIIDIQQFRVVIQKSLMQSTHGLPNISAGDFRNAVNIYAKSTHGTTSRSIVFTAN